ncbi:MAG TPA: phospholipase D-like domain-containing protein [Kofleriaceae bacterium]|nr:phospholipase D-like domain-containing protein [Kofleriaceae bacterium]
MRLLCLAPFLLLFACREAPTATIDGSENVPPDAAIDAPPDAAPDAGPDFCNATDPRDVPLEIAPTPEAGEAPYLDALATATTKIRVEIYEMGYGGILDTLSAKAKAGVTVQILFDQSEKSVNQKYFDQLAAAGAQCKWSDPKFTYQHAKFFVVDDSVAVLSTGNYSYKYSINLERNFVVTDRDNADIADLLVVFDSDWQNITPNMSCTRMVISPVNSRQRILDVINSAQTTLTIESMQFADTDVRAAVAARVAAGVNVRVMIADVGFVSANAAAATYLKGLGLEPKFIPHLHTKVIVADGVRAYVGSENLSYTSLNKNREIGVIATDASALAPLMTTFETDWAAGTDF